MSINNVSRTFCLSVWLLVGLFSREICGQTSDTSIRTPGQQIGIVPFGTFSSDQEVINLQNGNVYLSLPLLSLQSGRGATSVGLRFNSRLLTPWINEIPGDPDNENPPMGTLGGWRGVDPASVGGLFDIPVLEQNYDALGTESIGGPPGGTTTNQVYCYHGISYVDQTGGHHLFRNVYGCEALNKHPEYEIPVSEAYDGSLYRLDTIDPNDIRLFQEDGTIRHFTKDGMDVIDANGNKSQYKSDGAGGFSFTDVTGRSITATLASSGDYTLLSKSKNGSDKVVTIHRESYDAPVTLSSTCTDSSGQNSYTSSQTFTQGEKLTISFMWDVPRTYVIELDGAGEPTRVTLPGGGYIRYEYADNAAPQTLIGQYVQISCSSISHRQLAAKYTCADPSGKCSREAVTTYTPQIDTVNEGENLSIDVRNADGREHHVFKTVPNGYSYSLEESGISYYQGETALLKDEAKEYWPLSSAARQGFHIPQPKRITTTFYDPAGKHTVSSSTEYEYATRGYQCPVLDSSFIPTVCKPSDERYNLASPLLSSVRTYDFDGTLLLQKQTTWTGYDEGDVYHLGLPLIEKLSTGAGEYDRSDSEYDNYRSPIASSGASNLEAVSNHRGNVTSSTKYTAQDAGPLTTYFDYEDTGSVVRETDPRGFATTYDYTDRWSKDCVPPSAITHAFRTGVTNALNQRSNHTFNYCMGLEVSLTDANSAIASRDYDEYGRLTRIDAPDGGWTTIERSDNSPALEKSTVNMGGFTKIVGSTLDGFGRPTSKWVKETASQQISTDTQYDDIGRVSFVSINYRGTPPPNLPGTSFSYDALSREISRTSSGESRSIAYSGNYVDSYDEVSNRVTQVVDAAGHLQSVTEYSPRGTARTDYSVSGLNRLRAVTQNGAAGDLARAKRIFTYDSMSRLLTSFSPESGWTCYGVWSGASAGIGDCQGGYDGNGNLLYKTDARNITISYAYDPLNRLTSKVYSDGTRGQYYGYDGKDESGVPLTAPWNLNAIGRLSRTTDGNTIASNYAYDLLGRVLQKSDCLPARCDYSDTQTAVYDPAGNLTSLTYPDGRKVQTSFDTVGRTKRVSFSAWGPKTESVTYLDADHVGSYDPAGHLVGAFFGNGIGISAAYDSRQRIGTLAYVNQSSQLLWGRNYSWKPNGNMDSWKDLLNQNTRQFGYDSLNRLTSAVDSVTAAPTAPTPTPNPGIGTGSPSGTPLPPATTFYPNINLLQGDGTSANPGWEARNYGVSWNSAVAPDQTNTAATIEMHDGGCNMCLVSFVSNAGELSGQTVTGSVYLRTDGPSFTTKLYIPNTANGTTTFPYSQITVTSTWQRYSVNAQMTGGLTMLAFQVGGDRGIPDGQTFQVWGAQLAQGSSPIPYRANLLPGDQLTGNPGWGYSGASPAWNSVMAPDGTSTAATFTATDSNGNVYDIMPDPAQYSGQTVTGSVWLKSTTGTTSAWLNLPVVTNGNYAQSGTTVQVSSNWQCFSYTQQLPGNLSLLALQFGGANTFTTGQTLQVWEPQLSLGTTSSCPASTADSSSATQVTIRFTNDSCSACSGQAPNQDRNLYVQSVTVGGQTLSSTDPAWNYRGVFYQQGGGVLGNGDLYATFSASGTVSVTAYGTPDNNVYPHMQLLLNGSVVQDWDVTGQTATYTYTPPAGGGGGGGGGAAGGSVGTGGMNIAYEYDSFGNLTKYGSLSANYDSNNHNTNLSYDSAGNQQYTNFGQQIAWDAESRISAVAGVQYLYDADGNRVATSNGTNTVYFGGRPIARYNNGQWTDLIYGPQGLIAEVVGQEDAQPRYRLTDNLGNLIGNTDQNQTVLNGLDYTPFGQVVTGSTSDTYFFTGKERDSESSLDNFGARMYASSSGHWLSPDPSMKSAVLEVPQTWNRYSYVYNNPLTRTDPDGACPICAGAVVGALAEGGFDLGKQLYHNGGSFSKVNWREVGANAAGGFISGGLAVATGGATLVESALVGDVAAGAAANMVGSAATRALDPSDKDGALNVPDMAEDAVAGLVGGAAGHIAAGLAHVPEAPRPVKTHSGSLYKRQLAKNKAATNAMNSALLNQAVRSAVSGSLSTHTINQFIDWAGAMLSTARQQTPQGPSVTVTACDTLPDGSTKCY